jgi:hypothetical protein
VAVPSRIESIWSALALIEDPDARPREMLDAARGDGKMN